jgi:hypothetical protein
MTKKFFFFITLIVTLIIFGGLFIFLLPYIFSQPVNVENTSPPQTSQPFTTTPHTSKSNFFCPIPQKVWTDIFDQPRNAENTSLLQILQPLTTTSQPHALTPYSATSQKTRESDKPDPIQIFIFNFHRQRINLKTQFRNLILLKFKTTWYLYTLHTFAKTSNTTSIPFIDKRLEIHGKIGKYYKKAQDNFATNMMQFQPTILLATTILAKKNNKLTPAEAELQIQIKELKDLKVAFEYLEKSHFFLQLRLIDKIYHKKAALETRLGESSFFLQPRLLDKIYDKKDVLENESSETKGNTATALISQSILPDSVYEIIKTSVIARISSLVRYLIYRASKGLISVTKTENQSKQGENEHNPLFPDLKPENPKTDPQICSFSRQFHERGLNEYEEEKNAEKQSIELKKENATTLLTTLLISLGQKNVTPLTLIKCVDAAESQTIDEDIGLELNTTDYATIRQVKARLTKQEIHNIMSTTPRYKHLNVGRQIKAYYRNKMDVIITKYSSRKKVETVE